jgi:hypothetical protein
MVFKWLDLLSIGAQISIISGFVYGFFWLERYRKQKVVEHQSDDAQKGLEQLVLIEESLDKIFSGTDIEQKEALFKRLPHALREEYNALLLLKELPGISEKLHLIEHLSETLVNTQHQPEVAVSMIQQIFAPVGGYKQECKELKERLVQIYVMRA